MSKIEIFIDEINDIPDLFFIKPYLKIEENNKIIGILEFFNLNTSNIEVTKVVVHPEYRNVGIGTDLINQALSLFETISVQEDIENVEFFEKIGFEKIKKFKNILIKKS